MCRISFACFSLLRRMTNIVSHLNKLVKAIILQTDSRPVVHGSNSLGFRFGSENQPGGNEDKFGGNSIFNAKLRCQINLL
jgi:hypothetical protein